MRSHRGSLAVIGGSCLLLVAGLLAGGVLGAPTATSTSAANAPTHTLVITSQNGSSSYSVTASEGLRLTNGEQAEYQLRGQRISGTVGKQGDTKDVIQYRGFITSFQGDGHIQVRLDGRAIAPRVLGGQHLRIAPQTNTSQPIHYQVTGPDRASRGEGTDQTDTATKHRIRGQVRADADSFYFTGDLTTTDLTISGPAQVMINGQNASVFLTHAPPTPTATPPPSPTATGSSTPATGSEPSLTSPSPSPSTRTLTSDGRTSGTSTDTGRTSLVDQLVRLIGGLITGIAALVAVLYLFLGE